MTNKSKLKCRYCNSDDLYLQQCIITRTDISEDDGYNVFYEELILYHDEVIEDFTCYGCSKCNRNLTIDDEYGYCDVVNEQNLEEYRQRYCSCD